MARSTPGGGAGSREVMGSSAAPALSPVLFTGVVVASIGGPLSLVALQIPASAHAGARLPWLTLAAALLFGAPLAVWYGYGRRIAGPGGLTAFVEAAAGRRVGAVQAVLWIISYGLYMVWTIPQVVYELLPAVLPVPAAALPGLDIGIAVAVGGAALLPLRWAAALVSVLAVGQVVLSLGLGGTGLAHPGSGGVAPDPGGLGANALTTAQISLFFICGSLPLFLASEVGGGARTTSRGLLAGFAVAAVSVLIGVAGVARAGIQGEAAIPGVRVATAVGGGGLAVAVGVGVAVSTTVLVLLEFVATTRLVHHLFAWPVRTVARVMAAALVVASAVTLLNPIGIYESLARPSLIALWLSQVIVFAVYPLYRAGNEPDRRGGRPAGPVAVAIAVAIVASALAVFGLLSATVLPGGS